MNQLPYMSDIEEFLRKYLIMNHQMIPTAKTVQTLITLI